MRVDTRDVRRFDSRVFNDDTLRSTLKPEKKEKLQIRERVVSGTEPHSAFLPALLDHLRAWHLYGIRRGGPSFSSHCKWTSRIVTSSTF